MLNIYYGRENINKDQFIFETIQKGKILLLVPDQFTLQAERNAFFYLGVRGLMDIEAVSISRLGLKVLNEVGGGKSTLIDKYGRHMLLAKIMAEKKDQLSVYRGLERKNAFIEMTNNFISQLKQYGATPERIGEIVTGLEKDSFLSKKLKDIQIIYESYQKHIQGKYIDTEDYVSLYTEKILQSEMVKSADIWVYGFDNFTPKNQEVLGRLMTTAKSLNVVLTYDEESPDAALFHLTGNMIETLCNLAQSQNIEWKKEKISKQFAVKNKPEAIAALEQNLYVVPPCPVEKTEGLTLLKAANFYGEAESAAAAVLSLVRDKGMQYKDIVLICNDMESRGSIIKRVFAQYGLELFLDRKRSILHNPAVGYILSLLEIVTGALRNEDIFRFLKTGLSPLGRQQIEDLENYVLKYRIKGNMWKKPFLRGKSQLVSEDFQAIEESRQAILDFIEGFSQQFFTAVTVKEKVFALYYFLRDEGKLPVKLEQLIRQQEQDGSLDLAAETAQVWGVISDILDQLVEITGEETLLVDNFGDILKAGFESVEVGLLPPAADGLLMGTMQRTRTSHVKAMFILGANEGVLPANTSAEDILSEDEKNFLREKEIQICKLDELRLQEEKLAIYKNITKPSHSLWISYSASDIEGKELKPSAIFETIGSIFPKITVQPDILNRGNGLELIEAKDSTLEHMTQALRRSIDGPDLSTCWKEALVWYQDKGHLDHIKEGLLFTNKQGALEKQWVEHLYNIDMNGLLSISPSRLEQYSRCPFSHFIQYGLRPEERRLFEVGGREIGDIYHQCLMELSESLTLDGVPVNAPQSPWMTVTKEECSHKIREVIDREIPEYREGVFSAGKEEEYRTKRLSEICSEISWVLIDHVRRGSIKTIAFEESFGRGKNLPPVEVDAAGTKVLIEGKIDRMDILTDDRVKIIDYKTGREKFDVVHAEKGYKLQLMVYLKAAQKQEREPAGVFYFLINEPFVDASGMTSESVEEAAERESRKKFKLDGVMVNEPEVINHIAGDFSGFSDIVPVKKTQKGIAGTGPDKLLSQEAFAGLQETVDKKIKELCEKLVNGDIEIHPKKTKDQSACTYCKYKGICKFDLAFEGCKYELI